MIVATPDQELLDAASVLSQAGLVTAFGHVSGRVDQDRARITPGVPLGTVVEPSQLRDLDLRDDPHNLGVPGEAWIHWAIYRARPDVGGICRAQPPAADIVSAMGVTVVARHGQGAMVAPEIPVHDDPRLVRERDAGVALATTLGEAQAIVMRGNGAVTVGQGIGAAVARMYVLERSAQLNIAAASSSAAMRLSPEACTAWEQLSAELLERIWSHLRPDPAAGTGSTGFPP